MEIGASPRMKTSRKSIVYRRSVWSVHQFEIWSGELLCRVVALRVVDGVLVWLGGAGEPQLGEIALGVPAQDGENAGRTGHATALIGAEGSSTALARRLATLLVKPVYVCSGIVFDRFTRPLIEKALVAEIKSRPELF